MEQAVYRKPNNGAIATSLLSISRSFTLSHALFSFFLFVFFFKVSLLLYLQLIPPTRCDFVLFFACYSVLHVMTEHYYSHKRSFRSSFYKKWTKWWSDRYFKITRLWYFKAVTSKKLYTNMSSCLMLLVFAQCSNLSSCSFEGNSTILRSIAER